MSQKKLKNIQIDNRDASLIEKKISDLASQYETGWEPDYENPDIGTAIAKVYAKGIEDNIGRVNNILDRYHTEFVNMLDMSLLAAKPASSIVVMQMLSETVPGTAVPKGTKLLYDNGDEPYVFETDHSLYVSSSRVSTAFMTDGEEGSIVPLLGRFTRPLLPGERPHKKEADTLDEEAVDDVVENDNTDSFFIEEFKPFTLYNEKGGIERNAVCFYHPNVFDTGMDDIYVRIEGNSLLVSDIENGLYIFCFEDKEGGIKEFDHVSLLDDRETFILNKDNDSGFTRLLLVAKEVPKESKKVKRISFSSKGKEMPAEAVSSGSADYDINNFAPFTDTLTLYSECYICHNRYFSKVGAKITITFDIFFDENRITLTTEEEEQSLKIIKRRNKASQKEIFTDCYAQEIVIEYFTGTVWKKLQLSEDPRMLFYGEQKKHVELEFICPSDWEETENGSNEGKAIRITLIKSDNCYLRPAVHHYPIVKNLLISYTYEDRYVNAAKTEIYYDTKLVDISDSIYEEKGYTLIKRSDYIEDALYLGFSGRIENGPASILFQLQDGIRFSGIKCHFEYLGHDGWRSLKVLDYTENFTRSGVVMFMPPSDMKLAELEKNKCYYIRILRVNREASAENTSVLPKIENIVLNAVQVSNIETMGQVPLYIDEPIPNMRFALGATNVLDAEVWVNEMGKFSIQDMRDLYESEPEKYQIEADDVGNILAFFVKWSEVERFETSEDKRVYVLDRHTNELIFGDGVRTWMPRITDNTSVRFTVRCCNGQAGNVEAFSISEPLGVLNFIGEIYNPVKAYGGSNIETLENALLRGAGMLSSRNRLVSMDDFIRTIMSYSDTIDQVAGITGMTIDGKEDDAEITFLLLMKDFAEGSFAFHRIVGGLKNQLVKNSELTLIPDKLHIVEPIYVDISVNVWVNIVTIDESFEIQGLLEKCLEDYLNPLGYNTGSGWKIGTIPKKPQILMRLSVLKSRAIVKKSVMIAHYTDADGEHEMDLGDLVVTPFMVCKSGKHKVNIIY